MLCILYDCQEFNLSYKLKFSKIAFHKIPHIAYKRTIEHRSLWDKCIKNIAPLGTLELFCNNETLRQEKVAKRQVERKGEKRRFNTLLVHNQCNW